MLSRFRHLPVPVHVVATLFAVAYALAAAVAMWLLSPRVPYADGWRHLGRYLALPFPQDVLAADNGHLELLPNLVRLAELEWLDGERWLSVLVGMVLAAATVALAWPSVRRLPSAGARAAGMLAVVLGVYWLGNFRALVHGNESVHAYAVTASLMAGLWCVAAQPRGPGAGAEVRAAVAASLCGLAAALSFGSGIACFAAFGTVLLLRRSMRALAVLVGGLAVTLVLVRLAGGDMAAPEFDPWRQCELLLRWLAGPPVHAVLVLLDPGVAAQVPVTALRTPLEAVARASEAAVGPVRLARWPHVAFAGAGLAGCAWLLVDAWRRRDATPAPCRHVLLTGLGLCAFALAAGVLVAAMRLSYFEQFPGQLLAPRYFVWSSLFWAGLLLATVARSARHPWTGLLVVAVAVFLLPSQVWSAELARRLRPMAEDTALAAAVGVLEPGRATGETVPSDVVQALPLARAAGVSVFAWPEARALGRVPDPDGRGRLAARDIEVVEVDNLLPGAARRVRFAFDGTRCARLLLVDADGTARGLARQDVRGRWIGWMRGRSPAPPVAVDCAVADALPARR